MLTRDLIRSKTEGDRLVPFWLRPTPAVLELAGDLLAHALEYTARAPSAWASTGSCACRAPTGPTASATKVASCVFNNSVFEEVYARGESLLNSSHRLVRAAVLRERGWRRAKIQKIESPGGLGLCRGPRPPARPAG